MMNNEKEKDAIDTSKLDEILPKYDSLKLNGINLAQNYVSAFNTGMNIYQCVNQLQGYIEWVVKAVNDVVKSWNVQVGESINQSKAIVRETTTEQFNIEWTNKQPELIEQVNTLTTNQFNEDWGVLENRINTTLETQNTNIQNIQNEQNELETNTNNNINAQNTKINSIQTQQNNLASNQTNLSNQQTTLSNRMNTFTSLSEGSTTGDAELKDIRVGANGVTYPNAGDAVRGQYSQLKEDLEYEANRIRAETQSKIDYSEFGLPTLYLSGDVSGMSKSNAKTLLYTFGTIKGSCKVKWQGSSSIAYPKKNYTIIFNDPIEVVNKWGKQSKYCLKANWIDFSHSRNVVSAKLWGDIVRSRRNILSNIETENENYLLCENGEKIQGLTDWLYCSPNGGAVDGFPCVIYLNNDFLGLYSWNIPKDKWMMNMGYIDTEYMVTAENHTASTGFYATALLDGSDFNIEYKKDSVSFDTVKNSLNTMISKVMSCDSYEKYVELGNYIDINLAIDYYIFVSLICAQDCVDKNYILATKDGVKWSFVAYDLDTVFGNNWDGKSYYSYNANPSISNYPNNIVNLIKTYDKESLKNRYKELSEGILSEDSIYLKFSNYIAGISSIVKNADAEKWKIISGTLTNNLEQILNYYSHRLPIINEQINNL